MNELIKAVQEFMATLVDMDVIDNPKVRESAEAVWQELHKLGRADLPPRKKSAE